MWECEKCHHWNPDRAKKCEQCGTSKLDSEFIKKEREEEEEEENEDIESEDTEPNMWDEDSE